MKKFSRIFFSLIITLFATSMVFSFSAVNVQAEGNHGVGGSGENATSSGDAHHVVFLYKITVYADTTNKVTKYSDISEFNVKKFMYLGRSGYPYNSNAYVGSKTKYDYVKNQSSIAATTISKIRLENQNVPEISINTTNLNGAYNSVVNYFGGSNDSKCYSFVKKVAPEIEKDDSWILLVEPVVKVYNSQKTYFYTPTEYAVAMNSSGERGYFNSFNTGKTSNGLIKSVCSLTMRNPGNMSVMVDGSWLNVGGYSKNWNEINFNSEGYNAWYSESRSSNFIKGAGVFMWFSKAFEKSDYTLGEVQNIEEFEDATKELSINVKRTNPAKDETVKVTLDLPDTYGAKITKNEATQSITFPKGVAEKTVSWEINVGSYGDTSNSRSYNYNIRIDTSDKIETDEMMKNNQLEGTITLKRDFKVTRISLNKDDCFENENVKVSFTVENANPHKEYNEVPVTVFFTYGDRTVKIGETVVNLGKKGIKNGSCSINVGNVTDNADQTDTVSVIINSHYVSAEYGSRYSEPDMSNNKKTDTIKVKRDINLSVSIVYRDSWGNPIGNAPSKVKNADKTQAVTTCAVTNHSRFNLYESDPMNDRVTVTFYVNDKKVSSQSVPIPRYGSNLVWFKWDVPEGSSVTLKAEVTWNVNQENSPSPYADNTATKRLQIDTVKEYATPDMGGKDRDKLGSNANYSNAYAYYRMKPSVAKWSQWVCDEKGVFTRIDYAMTGDSMLELIPDKEAQFYDGSTILSGSGFGAVFSYKVRTECSEAGYDVSEKDYTYAQTVVATFPEFNYTTKGECKTMYLVKEDGKLNNAEFRFAENISQDKTRKKRIHFTPKDMPDGEYKMGVVADHMWTPAGPIYVNAASSLMINGSAANDYMVQ